MNNTLFKSTWRGCLTALALFFGVQMMAQTFCTGPTSIQVGPNGGTVSTSTLTVSGLPGDINASSGVSIDQVCFDIQHTWASDLDIVLISPAGTRVFLSDQNGGTTGYDTHK